MKTPLFASAVTQNSRSRSKSAYEAAVSKNPVPESAATAPSFNSQFASPTRFQPAKVLPSKSVCHAPAPPSRASSAPREQPDEAAMASATTMSFARMDLPSCSGRATVYRQQPAQFPAELNSPWQVTLFRRSIEEACGPQGVSGDAGAPIPAASYAFRRLYSVFKLMPSVSAAARLSPFKC